MTDRELLEYAAKAAGIELGDWSSKENGYIRYHFITRHIWNPLTDDGDALRLAVGLGLAVSVCTGYTVILGAFIDGEQIKELFNDDPFAATRRAIVREAAEIGKGQA